MTQGPLVLHPPGAGSALVLKDTPELLVYGQASVPTLVKSPCLLLPPEAAQKQKENEETAGRERSRCAGTWSESAQGWNLADEAVSHAYYMNDEGLAEVPRCDVMVNLHHQPEEV